MIYWKGDRVPVIMKRFETPWCAIAVAAYRWYYCVDKLFFDSDKTNWFEWNRWHNAHPPEWFVSFWEERGLVLVEDGNNFSMRVPK